MMKEDFLIHNLYWQNLDEFEKFDPHLSRLKVLPFIYKSGLETEIPIFTPGIYILTGGRQVGKSTLLKMIIRDLVVDKKLSPNQVFYLPCDTIEDFRRFMFEIEQFRQSLTQGEYFSLFIDEISYVKEWDRTIKSLADAGFFNNGSVVITGSDSFILKEAMMKFPGRRGQAEKQDFHLYPLSFYQYIHLKKPSLCSFFEESLLSFKNRFELLPVKMDTEHINMLYEYFNEYLLTGGFMPAINDLARDRYIRPVTYNTYVQWVIGDILKRDKQELYLRELIASLISRLGKQISWHNLSSSTSIEHHQTVADYINILSYMDVLTVLKAFREDKLQSAPKKAKKIGFNDPFIFHSLHSWIKDEKEPFRLANEVIETHNDLKNALIEATIASLFSRTWELYYIKAEGEVDIVLKKGDRFFPIEIKNTISINRRDVKQILKYKYGIIGYSGFQFGRYEGLDTVPIPVLALLAG